MAEEPRYVSEVISITSAHEDGTTTGRFVFNIYDTHKKKSLRGIKLKDRHGASVLYEFVETAAVGEIYPEVYRKAEQRLAELNSSHDATKPDGAVEQKEA